MTLKKTCPITKEDTIRREFDLHLPNGSTAKVSLFSSDGTCMSGSIKLGAMTLYIEPSFKGGVFKQVGGLVAGFTKSDDGIYTKLQPGDVGIAELSAKVLFILNADDKLKIEMPKLEALVNKRIIENELFDIDAKIKELTKKEGELEVKLAKMEL